MSLLIPKQVNITIRQEQDSDHKSVFALNRNAFGREDEAKLVEALRGSDAFIPELSLVAWAGKRIVGHILFSRVIIRNSTDEVFHSLSLAPMAVDETFQNRGIGSLLVNAGFKKATEIGYGSVIVLGHSHYYPRFGFEPAAPLGIRSPYDVPENAFMAIELVSGSLDGVSGTVEYPKEFEDIS